VANWLSGMVPASPVPEVLAHLFAQRLGRAVTLTDLGYAEEFSVAFGLTWDATVRGTVGTVAQLWRIDMERRSVLLNSVCYPDLGVMPTRAGEALAATGCGQCWSA